MKSVGYQYDCRLQQYRKPDLLCEPVRVGRLAPRVPLSIAQASVAVRRGRWAVEIGRPARTAGHEVLITREGRQPRCTAKTIEAAKLLIVIRIGCGRSCIYVIGVPLI